MAKDNLEILRAAFEGFAEQGGLDPAMLTDDFVMHQASSIVDTEGVFRGPEGLAKAVQELGDAFEGLRFEPRSFVESPDGRIAVVVRVSGRGRGSRIELDNQIGWVWTMRDGRASRLVVYEEPADALAALSVPQ